MSSNDNNLNNQAKMSEFKKIYNNQGKNESNSKIILYIIILYSYYKRFFQFHINNR
jgi:hypothetical protein